MRILNGVYLLHLEPNGHYVGFSMDIAERFEQHRNGKGSGFTKKAVRDGFSIHLVRVWEFEDLGFEGLLHRRKNYKGLCPVCEMRGSKIKKEILIDDELIEDMDYEPVQERNWQANIIEEKDE